ncbi:bifunctional metallophosphatase/5'-nucleotidase [Methylobacterium iners]|uniref:5'-Nucleotidase C-terminal domain-containing protein n=1 Tax=Methylobacterium iners TaxID=418707 RepID=A0ABQ4RYQ3_9HYPH|nr:bifunctional metallophosphatase/5'-nucleotidase [Methylobacterium iners]GJD94814.1 hypothetical protein OCOJLMKI_2020 [Methylobacterium iners]
MAGGFTLQLLHMSDGEGSTLTPTTAPIMGALIDRFDNQFANTLVLAGGDNFIPGPFLTAGADPALNAAVGGTTALGRPDIAIYNAFGVRASTIGNHEFDLGSATLQGAYAAGGGFPGAQFPYLSANLDFSGDAALRGSVVAGGQNVDAIRGRIAPSAVVTINGERVGLVGATTQVLERISSPTGTEVRGFPLNGQPGDNQTERDDMALLASQLQPVIDALVAQGVTRIILQSHLQLLSNEIALAPLLRNVDVILAAGSHTRLGDSTDVPGAFPGHDANFAGPYPIATTGADGNPTLIVNTDSESTYLGRLVVTFDAAGRIVPASLNPAINGAYASNQATLQAAYGTDIGQAFAPGSIGARVQQITGAVDGVIRAKEGNVFGFTDVYLEGDRTAGRSEETNLGNLTADANAAAAANALPNQPFIVSLKNGGGIRASIGSVNDGGGNDPNAGAKGPPEAVPSANKPLGGISQLDTENALRFDNKLMVFDTTPQGLLNILNYGAGLPPGNGGFPQIGGVQFSYDPSLPAGQRVRNVALVDEDDRVIARVVENGRLVADAPATISIVTLNFTANGGDGYPTKQNGDNFRFLLDNGTLSAPVNESLDFTAPANVPANALGEQRAFTDFVRAEHGTPDRAFDDADTPASQDIRIENLRLRADAVFDSAPVVGTAGNDSFRISEGNDSFNGRGGTDALIFDFRLADARVIGTGAGDVVIGPDGFRHVATGIERFEFTDRTVTTGDGAPLVDDLFYLANNPDVAASGRDADAHYAEFGFREGRDPNAFFSTTGYLAANSDVRAAGLNPLTHYEGFGFREGRDPGAAFDTQGYLARNADVRAANVNPLTHYLEFGQSEGRTINAAVGRAGEIGSARGFDAEFYLLSNPDVARAAIAAGGDGLAFARSHFTNFGAREGRDANAIFDTDAYLAAYPDVARSTINPLVHYDQFGFREGRDPSTGFDTSAYLAANADVRAAGIDPMIHYLQFGLYEGRSAQADTTFGAGNVG